MSHRRWRSPKPMYRTRAKDHFEALLTGRRNGKNLTVTYALAQTAMARGVGGQMVTCAGCGYVYPIGQTVVIDNLRYCTTKRGGGCARQQREKRWGR